MAVYFSFHYDRDQWRVQQIINMGAVEGQTILNSQGWEAVKKGGDDAIKKWIDEHMAYKSAVVVLVGAQTATRRWVRYEIIKAWNDKRPLLGVRIHGLADGNGQTDSSGADPFGQIGLEGGGTIGDYVTLHRPNGISSTQVYADIKANLKTWASNGYKRS